MPVYRHVADVFIAGPRPGDPSGTGHISFRRTRRVTRMGWLGEVGEFGLNHIPAKNAACESGPEGSNPSLSATSTERTALGAVVS